MIKKKIKIGFDLDGVIVGKPFFIPRKLLEWLVRSHNNQQKKYRFPKLKVEIWLRKTSHHWLLRPPLKRNLEKIRELSQLNNLDLYSVSGRYGFLQNRTRKWIQKNKLKKLFKGIYINDKNQQPHLFKEKMIEKLGLDYFFDDDPIIINHLKKTTPRTKFYLIKKDGDPKLKDLKI